jgi:hypothetical protein
MTTKLVHFLLVFDHAEGRLVHQQPYDASEVAVKAYFEMEQRHRDDANIEIVLIGSDSIDTVRMTHANYFDGSVAISPHLVGI